MVVSGEAGPWPIRVSARTQKSYHTCILGSIEESCTRKREYENAAELIRICAYVHRMCTYPTQRQDYLGKVCYLDAPSRI